MIGNMVWQSIENCPSKDIAPPRACTAEVRLSNRPTALSGLNPVVEVALLALPIRLGGGLGQ